MTPSRPTFVRLTAACCALLVLALATAAARPAPAATAADDDLHQVMMGLKRHIRDLGRAAPDRTQNDKALAALAEMQALTLAGKPMEPSNLSAIAPEAQPAHRNAYRADMARLLRDLAQMEIEILEGRNDAASAMLPGSIANLRDSSHEKYQDD